MITTKKISHGSPRKWICQISWNYILHIKFLRIFPLCFHNSCEIWHSLSWTAMRNFLCCYYRLLILTYIFSPWKMENECNILKIIPQVQGFCSLRIKITQFPGGFLLKLSFCMLPSTNFKTDNTTINVFWVFFLSFCVFSFYWTGMICNMQKMKRDLWCQKIIL